MLLLDLKRRSMVLAADQQYVCPFGLKPPQHPLIMLFQKKEVNVLELVNKINGICSHHDKEYVLEAIKQATRSFIYFLSFQYTAE